MPQKLSHDGWGIGNDNGGAIDAYDMQLVDYMRGIVAEFGGSVRTFGDCSIVHNKNNGITAADGGSVYFAGEGSGYIAEHLVYGAHAFSKGMIRFGYGGTHTIIGGNKSLRVDTKGLIAGEIGKVSYSTLENVSGGDGMVLFR